MINTDTYFLSCTVSKLWLIIGQIFPNETECLTLSLSLGVTPANIAINDISLKLDSVAYISAAVSTGVSSTTFTQSATKVTEVSEITRR